MGLKMVALDVTPLVIPLLLLLAVTSLTGQANGCEPPNIHSFGRIRTMYYTPGRIINLPCVALRRGEHRSLQYTFLENGRPLDVDRSPNHPRILHEARGHTLRVSPTANFTTYQCKVSNECGTSVSDIRTIRLASMGQFRPAADRELTATVGSSVVFQGCTFPASVPRAISAWALERSHPELDEDDGGGYLMEVHHDHRVTMDDEGRLYITNVRQSDSHNGRLYMCLANNVILRSLALGPRTKLRVIGSPEGSVSPPEPLWNSPTDAIGLEGEEVTMKCIFGGNPTPEIEWRREGGALDPPRMREEHFEMVIRDLHSGDAGTYICRGTNTQGVAERTFTLRVDEKPRWTSAPQDATVSPGATVVFSCRAEGRPTPHLQWYINGVPIEETPPSPRRSVREDSLTLARVLPSDSQVIQCNASNVHDYVWSEAYLEVRAPPTTTKTTIRSAPPENCIPPTMDRVDPRQEQRTRYFLTTASREEIPCRAHGSGNFRYSWLKNGQPLDTARGNGPPMVSRDGFDDSIWFLNPQQTEDLATYQCKVTNECGTTLSNVTTFRRTFLDPFPATPTRNVTASPGYSVVLPCAPPRSVPKPGLFWGSKTFDGQHSDNIALDNRVTTDDDGNLYITRVQPQDSRWYECNAFQMYNRTVVSGSKTRLQVLEVPAEPAAVELMWRSRAHVVVLQDSDVNFKCIFSGNPLPRIVWRRAGGPMRRDRMEAAGFAMTIRHVQFDDAGQYTCAGTNVFTRVPLTSSFTLEVETKPTWVHRLRDQEVGVGGNATFLCEAEGQPRPKAQWFVNGVPIDQTSSRYREAVNVDGDKLELTHLLPSDSMSLQCNVSNTHGYLWADARLQVRV